MECELCGNRPATVHIREIYGKEEKAVYLCAVCAEQYDADRADRGDHNGPEVTIKLEAMPEKTESNEDAQDLWVDELGDLEEEGTTETPAESLTCPGCGWTEQTLKDKKRLGCPDCYNAFWALLQPLIEDWHAEVANKGSLSEQNTSEITAGKNASASHIEKELNVAIACEDYERAAELRDRLEKSE